MKNMKKLVAMLLAVVMVMAFATTALAADPVAPNSKPLDITNNTFTAYQIFAGTQADDTGAALGEIVWGTGIKSADFLGALKADDAFKVDGVNAFASCTTAADVAAVMKDWADKSAEATAFARLAEKHITTTGTAVVNNETQLDAGYYLVVDTTAGTTEKPNPDRNLVLLQLTKKDTFAIVSKTEVPQVEKEVATGLICTETAADHEHTVECYNWAKSNNAAIGDTVTFKAEGVVPETATQYDYYYFILKDTMSAGLEFDAITSVTIDGDEAEEDDYTVKTGAAAAPYTFQVALTDAKDHAGEKVVVTYTAVLSDDLLKTVVGTKGNPNEVTIEYSNNPQKDYDGTKDNTDGNKGFPDRTKDVPTGETPKDFTITYTSKIQLTKVDGNSKEALTGAEFTLTGDTLNTVLVSKEVFRLADTTADPAEVPEYYKLNDGTYTKEAPVTAEYMKEITGAASAGYVVAEPDYAGADFKTVNEVKYRPYKPATDASKTVYILVEANVTSYATPAEKLYLKETVLEPITASDTVKIVGTVDENGIVTFTGLSTGTYTLEETKVPAGYNKMADITFEIECTLPTTVVEGTEECTWTAQNTTTATATDISYNATANQFEMEIDNFKGNTLPETGGIGTTIFYVAGAVMVAAAGILLVTKKRMGAEG